MMKPLDFAMMRSKRDAPIRAELYLRNDTYGTYHVQQRVLTRIKSLADEGVFNEAGLEATVEGVTISEADSREEAVKTYAEFTNWADANGFSLEPAFDRRRRFTPGKTELCEAVIFPVVSLAIYEGDRLRAVLPATDEYAHYTVHEALEGFERGDLDQWLSRFTGITVNRTEPRIQTLADL